MSKLKVILLISVIFLTGCTANTDYIKIIVGNNKNIEKNQTSENNSSPIFKTSDISDEIKSKMQGKSMPDNSTISYEDLSYLEVSYYDFDGNIKTGDLIVNKRLASEVLDIFKELYDKKYPINKISLIDNYDADDNLSMLDNNSSGFCYRTIKGSNKVSNHGKGMAIDINPFQNPHIVNGQSNPVEAFAYSDRNLDDTGIIRENDDCYNAFVSRGWTWGGDWRNPDYQHFEKVID